MLRIAILDDYQDVALKLADWASLGPDCEVVRFGENFTTEDAAAAALADFDVLCLMRERMPLTASLIRRLPRLRLVSVTGARIRSFDLDAAVAQGITICHTARGEAFRGVPELAWGLIFALARAIPTEDAHIRAGGWQAGLGHVLGGKVLGLVGLGKLGGIMAGLGQAFGMEVIGWSPNLTEARAAELGVRRVDKQALFAQSDVVSLHLILSGRSRGIVGRAELAAMKPGAMLINTARGPLVDEPALIEALEAGRIRAGLDVFETEPLPPDHPLRRAPNTVLTPHIGYATQGAYAEFFRDTVENIAAWRAGAPLRVLAAPTDERTVK